MMSNQRKYYMIFASIVISIAIILLRFEFSMFSAQDSIEREELLHSRSSEHLKGVPRFTGYPHGGVDDNKTAFVFGATGIYSTSELFKCMSSIESLTKIGGWKGSIYLLMDKDTCLNKKLLKSFPNQNIHIVPVRKERRRRLRSSDRRTSQSTGGSFYNTTSYQSFSHSLHNNENFTSHSRRKLLNSQPFERSMAIKMHLLDYLPSHIEYAVWYDCDVLFIRPNCAIEMIEKKPVITKEKPIFLSYSGHVGSFVVSPQVSREALDLWHSEVLTSNSPSALGARPAIPDYQVFNHLFGKNASDPNAKFGLLDRIWHDIMPKGFAPNHTVYWNTTACVVHLSNGRCRHLGPSNIDEFVKTLHLHSPGDRKWCPSVLRRKFKSYGIEWPFCWNPPIFWDG